MTGELDQIDDIVQFVEDRLNEDAAQAIQASTCAALDWSSPASAVVDVGDDLIKTDDREVANHIVRHDPARVLRGVEAKRRILELAMTVLTSGYTDSADAKMVSRDTIHNLASEWSTHEAYREEWTP